MYSNAPGVHTMDEIVLVSKGKMMTVISITVKFAPIASEDTPCPVQQNMHASMRNSAVFLSSVDHDIEFPVLLLRLKCMVDKLRAHRSVIHTVASSFIQMKLHPMCEG